MVEKTPLEKVLDKSEQDLQTVVERLEKAVVFVEQERQHLNQLRSYEQEYLTNIQEHQSTWNSQRINHYRSFCYQLNEAASKQQQKLDGAEQLVSQLRKQLIEEQHKISMLNDLIQQQYQQLTQAKDKRLQKDIDDLSSRRLHYMAKR